MRNIEFRAKKIEGGEWIYRDLRHHQSDVCIFKQKENVGYPVDAKTVGLFTGTLDKNGNKIYEGDVVTDYITINIVKWNKDAAGFYLKGSVFSYPLSEYTLHKNDLEVIGNIHDNLELLES